MVRCSTGSVASTVVANIKFFYITTNFFNFVLPDNPAYIKRKCFALSLYEIW